MSGGMPAGWPDAMPDGQLRGSRLAKPPQWWARSCGEILMLRGGRLKTVVKSAAERLTWWRQCRSFNNLESVLCGPFDVIDDKHVFGIFDLLNLETELIAPHRGNGIEGCGGTRLSAVGRGSFGAEVQVGIECTI